MDALLNLTTRRCHLKLFAHRDRSSVQSKIRYLLVNDRSFICLILTPSAHHLWWLCNLLRHYMPEHALARVDLR